MEANETKSSRIVLCKVCRGTGVVRKEIPLRDPDTGEHKYHRVECPQCLGSGRVIVDVSVRPYHTKEEKR